MSIELALYNVVHKGRYSPKQLADRVGKSHNYVQRMSSLTDSGCDAPLRTSIAMAKHQGDLGLAKAIALEFGGLFVRIPRSAINKKEGRDIVMDYQDVSNKAVRAVMNWLDNPTPDTTEAAKDAMDEMMRESAGIKKKIERENPNQIDLFD